MTRQALMGVALAAVVLGAGAAAAAGPAGGSPSDARDGHRRVRGEVVSIDEARGALTLKTGEGSAVALHLPPGALKGFRKGDTLVLELAVDRGGARAARPANGERRPAAPVKRD
jgi:hypothetical protein